ncbi:MAG: recombinase family protein [archaeon]|nr:recombinase family protein [archaeon]
MNEIGELKKENEKLRSELEKLKSEKERHKRGMAKKAGEGGIVARPPFGYKVVDGKLVKAENSQVVENIFLEFQGNEVSLNKLGKKYGFSVNGIKKILKNFSYLGKVKFAGVVYNGTHEPIVSSTLFNHVQDKLERLGIKS